MEGGVSQVVRDTRARVVAALVAGVALGAIVLLTFVSVVSAQAVAVDFSYVPAAPTAGNPVTFTSTSSLRRAIVREDWDFDGDGRFDASGPSAAHTYTSPGSYTVTLQVQNIGGRIRKTTKLVTVSSVSAPPPGAPPPPSPPPPPSTALPPSAPLQPVPVPQPTIASAAPLVIAPFPVVRITGSYTTLGVRLRLFAVTAPAGVRITVRCRGRGCPYRQRGPFVVRRSGTRAAGAARYVQIRDFRGRLLKPGVRLQVFIADKDRIGKYTSFTIRRGHPPLRADSCVRPAGASAVACE
jgi:plastocyanin